MTRISFYGDMCLHGIDPARYAIDPRIAELSRSSALNVANLEAPLTRATEAQPYKYSHMRADPVASPLLDLFDAFSLANNHIMDYQEVGLRDTIAFLKSLGKHHFGAGDDAEHARQPLEVELDGLRVAFLGFTRWQRAGRRSAGTAPDRVRQVLRAVQRLHRGGCFVVVYPHWNYEYVDLPAPSNRRIARKLLEAGADLVVGSHPHVVQGYESWGARMVYHSLGNFVFDSGRFSAEERADGRIHETFVLSVDVRRDRSYQTRLTPVHTDGAGLRVLDGAERARLLERLRGLSEVLTDERGARRRFYMEAAREARKVGAEMREMVHRQGIGYLLSRLHRVRAQDVAIKLHSLLHG